MTDDETFRRAILELLQRRDTGKSICPSEAARAIDAEEWRDLMPGIHHSARQLAGEGLIEICQKGRSVDPVHARGPIRLRLTRSRESD